jgi:hypothetical protein
MSVPTADGDVATTFKRPPLAVPAVITPPPIRSVRTHTMPSTVLAARRSGPCGIEVSSSHGAMSWPTASSGSVAP